MRDLRVQLLPYNPDAAYLTSTGWQMPDGTFKPHRIKAVIAPMPRPSLWARLKCSMNAKEQSHDD